MIRINLLPGRRKKRTRRKSPPGQANALVGLFGLGVIFLGCMLWNHTTQSDVDAVNQKNRQLEADTARIKSEIGDVRVLEAQKAQLEAEAAAIEHLANDRQLPCWAMHELSKLLTKDHEPAYVPAVYTELVKREPGAAFATSWDPKGLWVSKWAEKDHQVEIDGGARQSDDIAEFAKRLAVSVYFANVSPPIISRQTMQVGAGTNVDYYGFSLTATVNY